MVDLRHLFDANPVDVDPRVRDAARDLLACEASISDRAPLTVEWPDLDIETAYDIQSEILRAKIDAGQRIIGIKLGLTSEAKQQRMNVHAPLTAWLTDAMQLSNEATMPTERLIHPRVEPELVFVMGERLIGPGITRESAMQAVATVQAGLEVIDSRFIDYAFTLPDVIADNASAAAFVLCDQLVDAGSIDLVAETVVLERNDAVMAQATGAAVQGHPGEALALAANELGKRGIAIEAGWIVLTGGMTDAVVVQRGDVVTASFTHLGNVSIIA